jgi:hypothetical protein
MADYYDKILEEYHEERKTKKFYKTQGHVKILRYVWALIQGDEFQKLVTEMRTEYKIPEKGFETPKSGKWTHPPKTWEWKDARHYHLLFSKNPIKNTLRDFCKAHGILPRDWSDIFEGYIFYNRFLPTREPNAKNLCFVSDSITGRDSLGHQVDADDREIYPVTLHISPYASKRDVLDYIEAVFDPEIERLQKIYKKEHVTIGKHKMRSTAVRERNTLMNQHRVDSNKQISRIVKEQFPDKPLLPSSITKTIARERKRRQQV